MKAMVRCMYSCNECGVHRVICDVPAREDEGAVEWMEKKAILAVAAAHRAASPNCRAEKISELLIPTTGVSRVGGAIEN